jgi:NAD(P)-dependent dehydrogenase (short-subunit alcohol dehydrogenase family)
MELKGKTAIVTGAGRGIGEGIAKAVGREGANVVVNNRTMDGAEAVATAIERDGGSAMTYQADVTNSEAIDAMVEATVERFGAVDILVNNAGCGMARQSGRARHVPSPVGATAGDPSAARPDRYRRALMQERTRERRVERVLEDAQVSDGQFSWASSRYPIRRNCDP